MLQFLTGLEQNNDRDWYNDHKEEADRAKLEFENLVESLIQQVQKFIPGIEHQQAKDLIYRLNRDVRFSKDKTPYNPTFRALLSAGGKKAFGAGYFFGVDAAGQAFLGSGFHMSDAKEAVTAIREALVKDSQLALKFDKKYGIAGDVLKKVPAGYDADSPTAELLKHKSWHIETHLDLADLTDDEAATALANEFKEMSPFVDYLNEALKEVKAPERGGRR